MSAPQAGDFQDDLTLLSPPRALSSATPTLAPDFHAYSVWMIGLALAVVALWVGRWWWTRRRRGGGHRETPDATALRELAKLRAAEGEEHFSVAIAAISGTLRRYVAARFELAAATLTTEEFWAAQSATRAIPERFDPFWIAFLSASDPIKYAGAPCSHEQFDSVLTAAMEFVRASGKPRKHRTR